MESRRTNVVLLVTRVAEIANPTVFQKLPYDTDYTHSFGEACDAGSQSTSIADDEVNLYACLCCQIEFTSDIRIFKRIHFELNKALSIVAVHFNFALDFWR